MQPTPFIIGIAGGTGSGKTTIAHRVAAAAPASSVTMLEYDSYYRDLPDLSDAELAALNFDHPDSLDTALLVAHLQQLKAGQEVEVPIYDFTTHRRQDETTLARPTPVIVVEGILTFVDDRLRNLFDLKIFVDTDADIRVFRRIRRDIEQRGREFESIRKQYYETVRPMHLRFVEPSKRWADIILPEGGNNAVALDLIVGKVRSLLGMGSITPPPFD